MVKWQVFGPAQQAALSHDFHVGLEAAEHLLVPSGLPKNLGRS